MTLQISKRFVRPFADLSKCLNIRSQTTTTLIQDTDEDLINAKSYKDIPGELSLPVIGTIWTYLPYIGKYNPTKLHEASLQKYEKYGPIVRENITGTYEAVLLFDPQDMEKVFRHESKYPSRPGIEFLQTYRKLRPEWYKSGGLAVLTGKEWHDFRTKVQQTMLRPKSVLNYLDPMDQVANDMITKMKGMRTTDNEVPDFLDELYKWALESLASMALNKRLGCLADKLEEESEAMTMIKAAHGTFKGMNELLFVPLNMWKYFPIKSWRTFAKAQDDFAKIAIKYVQEAMSQVHNITDEDREMNFIQTLLTTKDSDPRDVVTMVLDMLLAGVDTTSHTTAFAIYHLAKHPEVQEKVHKEIQSSLSKNQPLTPKVMNDFHYLKACIKESMRLVPIVAGTVRTLDHDIVLSGYRIPAGVVLMFQNLAACRQEKYFQQADKFIPERWMDSKEHHPFLFLPFGFGRRMCIGRRIAEQEMLLLLTKLIQNFRIQYNYEDIDCYTRLVNVPDKPLRYQFINR